MAKVLPSDELLRSHYKFMDVGVDIADHNKDGAYINLDGIVTEVKVDGEDGCTLMIEVQVPLENIPEL